MRRCLCTSRMAMMLIGGAGADQFVFRVDINATEEVQASIPWKTA